MLRPPGALEREVGLWVSERAWDRARHLLSEEADPPEGNDLWSRAVRGCYRQLVAAKAAAEEAERMHRYAETDAYLARVKAGLEEL